METLEFYKLKDELSQLVKDEISKSLGNERDLQQRYIGLGLKVAAVGIAAAVLALGIFGIRSINEVNTAIATIPEVIKKRAGEEVTARFNSGTNPVAQYEALLLDSAARSVAASVATQAERPQNFSLDERTSDVIVRALNDRDVKPATKLSLISALSTKRIRSVSPSIDQAVIALTQQFVIDVPVNERSLHRCLHYFSFRNPERFAGEVENIYKVHSGLPGISLDIGRYAVTLRKEYGELTRKLEKSDDPNIKYLMHVRSLMLGKVKQVNRELFDATLSRALDADPDDGITLSDIIDHINAVNDQEKSAELVGQLVEAIRDFATSRKFSLAVEDDSPDTMSFRFYNAKGDGASASIDRRQFQTLIGLAADEIRNNLKQSEGEFTDSIAQAIDFWFPRADADAEADSRKAGAFVLTGVRKMRFVAPDDSEISGNTMPNKVTVTTRGSGAAAKVHLKWNSEDETRSKPIKRIVDFDPDTLNAHGIWDRVSNDD